MALDLGRHRDMRARGMHPKGTYQQAADTYVWPEEETLEEAPVVQTRPEAPVQKKYTTAAKIGHTDQKMWPDKHPSRSGLKR